MGVINRGTYQREWPAFWYHKRNALASFFIGSLLTQGFALNASIEQLRPGEWLEMPGTNLTAIKPSPVPLGNSGFRSVIGAWSGGAYDSKRERFIVWGGGHGDYSGNEVYALDIATMKWSRLTEPSTNVGGTESTGEYPDGLPRSRHTYNYLQYVPSMDRFCSFGGGAMYPSGGVRSNKVFCFDFETKTWEKKAEIPGTPDAIGAISGFYEKTGKIWVHFCGNNAPFMEFDPQKNAWTQHQKFGGGWFGYGYTGSIGWDRFVSIGSRTLMTWSLAAPAAKPTTLTMTGDVDILAAPNPGLEFHPKSGNFIAWSGGGDIYAIDISSQKITKIPPAATNKVVPTKANSTGTYGRFRYVASQDAFVVVNEVDQNVFMYKLPELPKVSAMPNVTPIMPRQGMVPNPGRKGEAIPTFPGTHLAQTKWVDSDGFLFNFIGIQLFPSIR